MECRAVKFTEFDSQTDNWNNYIDRLTFCFEANGVVLDISKRANFYTVCGAKVFDTLLALITPKKASEVSFKEIVNVLTKHFSPKPNEISVSYKFYKRDQQQSESAAEYIAQLRKISSDCNFSDLERMLRDRLVCGMKDHRLQYDLLKRDKLSYDNVMYRNYGRGPRWLPGTVTSKNGPSNYKVTSDNGDVVSRHIDQLIQKKSSSSTTGEEEKKDKEPEEQMEENIQEQVEELNQENEQIIQIPNSEEWAELLGIPSGAETTFRGGKLKNKVLSHAKSPYARPSHSQNYLV